MESYQSDQFGIYGEYYALFNWVSLPLFFLTAVLLKRIYVRLRRENPFVLVMMRVVVLSVWIKIINSYGLDWTIIETVPLVTAIYLYTFFFRAAACSRAPRRASFIHVGRPGVSRIDGPFEARAGRDAPHIGYRRHRGLWAFPGARPHRRRALGSRPQPTR